jgi:hypothetical protein
LKKHLRFLLLGLMLPALLMSDGRSLSARSAATGPERIRFRITTVEERNGERNVLSETTVEGPPGTDFDVNLQHAGFKMKAHFLTDLLRRDTLRVRAKLDTRRLYGYSEQQLPLYEEDMQTASLELGFDEAVVLLPFGQAGGADKLKIEIAPVVSERTARLDSGRPRPLEIEITKPSPGGFIGVEAFKVPHRFTVEALLLEDGVEVARGVSNNLLEEAHEFTLQTNARASAEVRQNPLVVSLSLEEFMRSRPRDQVSISFDLYRTGAGQAGERQRIASRWAGMLQLDSDMDYDLSGSYTAAAGRKYELRFRVHLAPGESAD